VKLRIRERTRLTCSIGLGPNRLVAKIASDLDKPDGLCALPRERFLEVVGERSARIIPGVGPKSEERLERAGIRTVAELAGADRELLEAALGPSHGPALARRAAGHGSAEFSSGRRRKSESRERTFGTDETDVTVMRETIERMARQVAEHLGQQAIKGRTVTLKIRLTPFRTYTRSRSLEQHTTDPDLIARTALEIFDDFDRDAPVRLLGVGISNLDHPEEPEPPPPEEAADDLASTPPRGPIQLALD
jgi:DNA polymerase-4